MRTASKKFAKMSRKAILKIAAIVFALTMMGMPGGVMPVKQAHAAVLRGTVTDQQVISYLTNLGYTNPVIYQVMVDGTRKCTSSNHPNYWTYVYVSQPDQSSIVGHEDIQM